VPDWVAAIGAFGMMLGVLLFGPRLIRMVGTQITKLNPIRSFCVAASTAFTVILASWMGLPLSTTHVAVGSVFGIGFFREYQSRLSRRPSARQVQLAQEDRHRRRLVRRSHFLKIMVAWMVTVPAVALFAAGVSTVLLWLF
ncbi:MAG: inorganic phosphate transporter, partial [Epibacterium sp.]|nr:inorganic phosphate transporter [Epibacterium sp.]NQX72715.1 inorganic phosphate transporter [Epibacterium sp.]